MSPTSTKGILSPSQSLGSGHESATTSVAAPAAEEPRRLSDANEWQPLLEHSSQVSNAVQTVAIIACTTCTTMINSYLNGMVTVALPMIAKDLELDPSLLIWPVSIFTLTSGCTLLLLGAVADVVGSRVVFLLGCFLQSLATLACGWSQDGIQLIVYRGLSGVSASFCLPAAVSIIYVSFPAGQRRNLAFALLGGGQVVGFSLGLTAGGALTDTVGWAWGFYIVTIITVMLLPLAIWQLPPKAKHAPPISWRRLAFDIDWVGAIIASVSLGLLSYTLAVVTADTSNIGSFATICPLIFSVVLMLMFALWVGRQERRGRPALIPNSLWSNKVFTSICINVFLVWGAFNVFLQIMNFFCQELQGLSALETALRFPPTAISGVLANIVMGLIVHRVRADWIVLATTTAGCIAPLLMAFANPSQSYWVYVFPGNLLSPVGADGLFTIANLLITSVFPHDTQALAGGVYNTIAQIGRSLIVAIVALVADAIAAHSAVEDKKSREALLKGYRGSFWFMFALNAASLFISLWGLRSIGRVGRELN